jgi:hypothetical protein
MLSAMVNPCPERVNTHVIVLSRQDAAIGLEWV